MPEPAFDADGYPTDATIAIIATWSVDDLHGWFEYVRRSLRWAERQFRRTADGYKISTGGWSGNESIISAMLANAVCWGMTWESSARGGHHTFDVE